MDHRNARDFDELHARRGTGENSNGRLGAAKVLGDQANQFGIGLSFDRRGPKASDPVARARRLERANP